MKVVVAVAVVVLVMFVTVVVVAVGEQKRMPCWLIRKQYYFEQG